MRRTLATTLVLLLLLPLAAAEQPATRIRHYESDAFLGLGSSMCWWDSNDDGGGKGAGCFVLDGRAALARVTLVDDTFGKIPARWIAHDARGVSASGTFCGAADIVLPVGTNWIVIGVDSSAPPLPLCDLGVAGLYTTGTITLTLR